MRAAGSELDSEAQFQPPDPPDIPHTQTEWLGRGGGGTAGLQLRQWTTRGRQNPGTTACYRDESYGSTNTRVHE